MNAVDTNVFIYRLDRNDRTKRRKLVPSFAGSGLKPVPAILLWQVAGELLRYLRSRQDQGHFNHASVVRYTRFVRSFFPLAMPTPAVLDRALDLAGRYSLSHWDSMLLGACIEAGVDTPYPEDMGSPITYDSVRLINPFA